MRWWGRMDEAVVDDCDFLIGCSVCRGQYCAGIML